MSPTFDEIAYDSDLKAALTAAKTAQWKLEKGDALEVFVTLFSESAPTERFEARLSWPGYPGEPPSLKFRDPKTKRLDVPTAWPVVRNFRPAQLDACVNWCAEGFTAHPEWKNDPSRRWNATGNPLLRTILQLQFEMDTFYEGRFAG